MHIQLVYVTNPMEQPKLGDGPVITKEMEEAGFWALLHYDSESSDPREMAVKVYRAMEAARGCDSSMTSSRG